MLSDDIIKIKNATVEIELHGYDLIKQYTLDDKEGTYVTKLTKGVPEILEYIKKEFSGNKIN